MQSADHGKNFFMDEFGEDVKNLWIPDVFGYSAAMPQIIRQAGCDYFLTQKISWSWSNKFPYHTFNWRGIDYHVDLVGVDVYAQGYSAVIPELRKFTGANMLCDIGNGTMIVMAINDRKPVLEQCFTEKYGTYQCVLKAREALTRLCGRTVPDVTIEQVMREGTADVAPEYVQVIREAAADYAAEIMRKLREHEYDPKTMRLWIVGGGGCLIRNFGQYDPNRVTIIGDIHASAKGYEYLAERRLQREARTR